MKKVRAKGSAQESQSYNDSLKEYLYFEKLISDLSAKFVNIAPDHVDGEIEVALKQVLDFFQVDRCGLLGFSADRKRVHVTHAAYAEGIEQVSGDIDLAALFPWSYERLVEGQPVCLAKIEELPETAKRDRTHYIAMGIRSFLDIPLFFEGRVSSIIAINDMHAERSWPETFIPRLRLLGEIFINAVERRDADRALRESEERLSLATDAAGVMPWTLDMDSGRIWTTEKGKEFFGFAPESEMDLDGFLNIVHPEDRENLRRTVELTLQSGKDDRVEYRIIRPDGSIRWVLSAGRRYPATRGRAAGLMGLSADITERKQSEERLKNSVSLMRATLESTADGILVVDNSGKISNFNDQFVRLWNIPQEVLVKGDDEIALKFVLDQLKDPEQFISKVRELYASADADSFDVLEFRDGRIFERYSQPQKIDDRTVGRVWSFRDVTKRKKAEEDLRKAYEEIRSLKEKLELENIILQEEVKQLSEQTDIVGQSGAMKRVLLQASQVAKTDTSVLILGETGAGKGLLAQAIHNMSGRKNHLMVSVNCAALPPTLIESELFGREKGAFTGALTRMAGRFEIADGSTLFLDEIGELPLELQAKMLRVIEEGKFERLGSTKALHVDVRVIAATNKDLAGEVERGRFRNDLFYRLNVFPIVIPPLRERPEDIPLLVWAFVTEFQKKMGKRIDNIPKKTMDALQSYGWPGNGRELRNMIERAMIVSSGRTLEVSLPENGYASPSEEGGLNLEDVERRHIMSVLKRTSWRVTGEGGAAEILGLKGTTLQSKMKKLGIRRPHS